MPGSRHIDYEERTRSKPMKVLIFGLSRTGTASICAALRKLSYTPFDMRTLLTNPDTIVLWNEGITLTLLSVADRPSRRKNRSIFPPYGKAEFDKLLADNDAVADLPAALFYRELVEAYPDARVVVTYKRYEEWEKSMQESVWLLLTWRVFRWVRYLGVTQMAPLTRLMHLVFRVHNGNAYGGPKAREAYEKYYADVRALVPETKRLEIEAGKGEWEPLLEFLGLEREVEKLGPYPNMEEGASMEKGLRSAWWEVVQWFGLMGMVIGSVVVGIVFIYYGRQIWALVERVLMVFEPYAGLYPREVQNATGKSELSYYMAAHHVALGGALHSCILLIPLYVRVYNRERGGYAPLLATIGQVLSKTPADHLHEGSSGSGVQKRG
ncbi:hypothetical protein M011DRAFT_462545 [Sporormia fimetaria CBS 119925]|uniref:NAD dependent epimerase/dehydratase n=1 Tax=Sporormia fimetaria CBS 119925 TaxID=1340428 RepID=A0A6A6UXU3_9PLEO|nr:hypothetical protein M011DRAFT_462545 [Sporormia fimetaria CBS 119925]